MSYRTERKRLGKKYKSATHYILSGLMPYTEANLKLSFLPSRFFSDLEKLDQVKSSSKALRSAYYRAIKKGMIEIDDDGLPRLTIKGKLKTKDYKPKVLGKNARLLLIFDIAEQSRWKRDRLRSLLRELSFEQVQKSVWECPYDYREYLKAEIEEIGLHENVIVYKALKTNL